MTWYSDSGLSPYDVTCLCHLPVSFGYEAEALVLNEKTTIAYFFVWMYFLYYPDSLSYYAMKPAPSFDPSECVCRWPVSFVWRMRALWVLRHEKITMDRFSAWIDSVADLYWKAADQDLAYPDSVEHYEMKMTWHSDSGLSPCATMTNFSV
eukprot:13685821-Ditylum_brightwellii.AAC.1